MKIRANEVPNSRNALESKFLKRQKKNHLLHIVKPQVTYSRYKQLMAYLQIWAPIWCVLRNCWLFGLSNSQNLFETTFYDAIECMKNTYSKSSLLSITGIHPLQIVLLLGSKEERCSLRFGARGHVIKKLQIDSCHTNASFNNQKG